MARLSRGDRSIREAEVAAVPPPYQCQAWHPRQTAKYVTVLWAGKAVRRGGGRSARAAWTGHSGGTFFRTENACGRTGTHARRTCVGVRSHVHMAAGCWVPGGCGLVAWRQRSGWWWEVQGGVGTRFLRSNMHSDLIRPNGNAIAISAGTLRRCRRTGVGPGTGRIRACRPGRDRSGCSGDTETESARMERNRRGRGRR